MFCENGTDKATLYFAESLPAQRDDQLAGRQTTLIL